MPVRDDGARSRVGEPMLERLFAEERKERDRDGSELMNGDVAERRLRRLGQQDADTVALSDTIRG